MKCSQCGYELDDHDVFCCQCGKECRHDLSLNDKPSLLVNLLCFFVPVIGLFLFLVWINTYPKKSKSCALWAIAGILTPIIIMIFIYIVMICSMFF